MDRRILAPVSQSLLFLFSSALTSRLEDMRSCALCHSSLCNLLNRFENPDTCQTNHSIRLSLDSEILRRCAPVPQITLLSPHRLGRAVLVMLLFPVLHAPNYTPRVVAKPMCFDCTVLIVLLLRVLLQPCAVGPQLL